MTLAVYLLTAALPPMAHLWWALHLKAQDKVRTTEARTYFRIRNRILWARDLSRAGTRPAELTAHLDEALAILDGRKEKW